MRNLLSAAGFAGLALVFAACGKSDDHPDAIVPDGGGKGGSSFAPPAGKTGASEGGVGGEAASAEPLAPVVNITAPLAVDDPNEEGVLSGTEVEVVCTAKRSPEPDAEDVDRSSVKLQLLDTDGEVIEEKVGNPTDNENEYSTTFTLTDRAHGPIGFRCAARDKGDRAGDDTISTLLDKGPVIVFLSPEHEGFHPLQQLLGVHFTVEAAPLADGDEGAEIDTSTITLLVGGKDIPLENMEVAPGEYQVEVDLTDSTRYKPPPNGPMGVSVAAANKRKPNGVTASASLFTSVDGAAPTITIHSPIEGAVVGTAVDLEFTVVDDVAGANPSSVIVSLNQKQEPYDALDNTRWAEDNGNFKFAFESREIQGSKVQLTVTIVASDRAGNESEVTSRLLYLDHVPPEVDLDPRNIRTLKPRAQEDLCSTSFDPVGPAALNDLQDVIYGDTVRAFVWDRTNEIPDSEQYHAGINADAVRLYVRAPSGDDPLLIDRENTGSGPCDEVGNAASSDAIELSGLGQLGSPRNEGPDSNEPLLSELACVTEGAPADEPLCGGYSDMEFVLERAYGNDNKKEATVWVAQPTDSGAGCTGVFWEFNAFLNADGWACLVARAEDEAGNVGVSRPIRVCVDTPEREGSPPCKTDKSNPPSCTNGCTPPPREGNAVIVVP